MGMALLLTFLRSYWAALIVVILLIVYLVRGAGRQRFIGWGLVAISSAVLFLLVAFNSPGSRVSTLLGASWDRFSTLGRGGTFKGEDSSVDWRKIETEYAFSAIASSPVIGLGMGAKYRPLDSRIDYRDADGILKDFRGHIHNGHLWILLQSGLLGYLSLMWLSLAFLLRGFRYWRSIPNSRMQGVVLGFTLAYLAVLIAAGANSSFMQWRWTTVIGIIMGINEVVLGKVTPDEATAR
jgi:O-antigen ligase